MAVTEDQIRSALARVSVDGGSLPGSGRLSGIAVEPGGRVSFAIAVTPAEAARMESVRREAEGAALSVPGVTAVFASLTGERGPGAADAGGSAAPSRGSGPRPGPGGPPRPQAVPGIRHIVAVASGKGGVGKSTLACNLALALAASGRKVGLLDADIYGPSAPKLLGLGGRKPRVISGRILEPLEAYGILTMSIGFLVEEETAMIWRGPMVMSALTQMLREVAWGDLDMLLVDMPPGTGDAQLTMAQGVPLAGAVIVSTPQDLALIDARRGIAMFRKVEVPILGVVENMAAFACPHCGEVSHIFGEGGARREAERQGVPFLGEIPLDVAIRETSDSGRPITAAAPDGPHARAFAEVAARVWERVAAGTASRPAPRIVVE